MKRSICCFSNWISIVVRRSRFCAHIKTSEACRFSDRNVVKVPVRPVLSLYAVVLVGLMACKAASADETEVRPAEVGIGALLGLNSKMGMDAKLAMERAVEQVNKVGSVLDGTKLRLEIVDSNCDALQAAAAAISLFENEVVAVIGPQTSTESHFVACMGDATHVPVISFSATDPNLSRDQYDYFFRLAHSDHVQMMAIASVLSLYGWREVVVLYKDDDDGRSGVEALNEALNPMGGKIVTRVGFLPGIGRADIRAKLSQLAEFGSRIYIVHMEASMSRSLFIEAFNIELMSTGFVWIATEATSSALDMVYDDDEYVQATQGVLGIRSFIPDSVQLQAFVQWWKQMINTEELGGLHAHINIYTLYAYDSIWIVANALSSFLNHSGTISFASQSSFRGASGQDTDLSKLKLFEEGPTLLQELLRINFRGITGDIQFNNSGDVLYPIFEIVNMVGRGVRVVGYWTENAGCSLLLPTAAQEGKRLTKSNNLQKLQNVIWPGGTTRVPQGWVFPTNRRPLLVAVPYKQGYEEFVGISHAEDNVTSFEGFCIDTFKAALSNLPYYVPYSFVPFGNGGATPSYDDLVAMVANKEFDAAVGDIEITTNRSKIVDFTQPYIESGLILLVPLKPVLSNYAWAFLQPFSPAMWFTSFAFFLFSGLVMWVLEHKKNSAFRGRAQEQIANALWFIFSTLFFVHRGEDVKSILGKFTVVVWLFVILILKSSYTANLASILTVQQVMPTFDNVQALIKSNVLIGYQTGSFVKNYLMQLNVAENRLVNLSSLTDYATALDNGLVGAIIDELPYIRLFLSSECNFTSSGSEFARGGWGFAFGKGSQLAIDISQTLLQLSETGDLQRMYDSWLHKSDCTNLAVNTNISDLTLSAFWGLFLTTGITSLLCCLLYAYLHYLPKTFGKSTPSYS